MKRSSVALLAVCSALSLISAAPALAGGGHGIRVDAENGAGCMSTYNTVSTENSPSGMFTSGAGTFIPGSTYLNATVCTPNFASNPSVTSVLFPDGTFNGAANGIATSPYIATNATMYQYFTGAITTGTTNNIPDAQVAVWSLANTDTEIELNGWCTGGSGASFSFAGNKYAGGCGTSPDDLLLNKTGSVIGYVTYAANGSSSINALSGLTGWTENGTTIGGSSTSAAPEIDPSSATAALMLLFGGLAVVRGRRTAPVRSQ